MQERPNALHPELGLAGDAGKRPLSAGRLEPRRVLDTLARSTGETLGRGFDVVVRVDDQCPPCLADEGAVYSMLTNLIAKLVSAMPGGGVISLHARPASDGSKSVEFLVRDQDQLSKFSARVLLPAFIGR